MNTHSTLSKLFLATSSFAGGLALGLLLAPGAGKQNRTLLRKKARSLGNWIEQHGRDPLILGAKHFASIRNKIQQQIDHNVPDLYRATEQLQLDDDDFLHV